MCCCGSTGPKTDLGYCRPPENQDSSGWNVPTGSTKHSCSSKEARHSVSSGKRARATPAISSSGTANPRALETAWRSVACSGFLTVGIEACVRPVYRSDWVRINGSGLGVAACRGAESRPGLDKCAASAMCRADGVAASRALAMRARAGTRRLASGRASRGVRRARRVAMNERRTKAIARSQQHLPHHGNIGQFRVP